MEDKTINIKKIFSIICFLLASHILVLWIGIQLSYSQKTPDSADLTRYSFNDSFSKEKTLEETGRMDRSLSPYWWLNSGAYLIMQDGIARTVQGDLEIGTKWQISYADYNSDSTDGGLHPQNILRLLTRSAWFESTQIAFFRIVTDNLSPSDSRNESNGLLLFSRYLDEDNLYYAGLRVDGAAIIKKKYKGTYYTLGHAPIFEGEYHRDTNPNLLPIGKWLGLKSEINNLDDNIVEIKLYLFDENTETWQLLLTSQDDGTSYGGEALLSEGYAGIRTDFMDVEFDNYQIEAHNPIS